MFIETNIEKLAKDWAACVSFAISEAGDKIENYCYCTVGKGSYASSPIKVLSSLNMNIADPLLMVHIGRYTSIGSNLNIIMDMNHDIRSVYMGVIDELGGTESEDFRARSGQNIEQLNRKAEIVIGNDCWIGQDVTILGGVTVHDGAVIGAGAVVTKDIPPYAVAVGNPAKVIKYRFAPDTCKQLQRISWWNWSSERLIEAKEDLQGDAERFALKYASTAVFPVSKNGSYFIKAAEYEHPIILYFLDMNVNYPCYPYVISEYVKAFPNGEAELVLAYREQESDSEIIQMLVRSIEQMGYPDALINLWAMNDESDESKLLCEADYFITNRSERTVTRVTYADIYGITQLSGFERPIFPIDVIKKIKNLFRGEI